MHQTVADGRVSVTSTGSGPPVVLLHSLLSDASSFDRVAPAFADTFRVHVPDLPGFGRSAAVAGGLEAVADRVAEAVREVADGQPVVGLGNGYGGFVLLQCVIRHPKLFDRLVFADCGARFSDAGQQTFRAMEQIAAEKGLSALAETAMRRLFAPAFQAAHPDLMAERRAAFLRTDPAVFRAACRSLADLDLRSHLSEAQVPALVLVGEQDEATPPAMARELVAGLPNARLVILPDCAHVPQLQAPDEFASAVSSFLAQ